MPTQQQQTAKKGPKGIIESSSIFVTLRCDNGRSTGHENVSRYLFKEHYAGSFLNRYTQLLSPSKLRNHVFFVENARDGI